MKNKEIMYEAFENADTALQMAIELRDQVEALFGENFPLTERLDEIVENLSSIGDIHYNIGGGGMVDRDMFCEWLSDEREWGQCRECANRTATEDSGFHRCVLTKGDCRMSPEYGCYNWKPKDNK